MIDETLLKAYLEHTESSHAWIFETEHTTDSMYTRDADIVFQVTDMYADTQHVHVCLYDLMSFVFKKTK